METAPFTALIKDTLDPVVGTIQDSVQQALDSQLSLKAQLERLIAGTVQANPKNTKYCQNLWQIHLS